MFAPPLFSGGTIFTLNEFSPATRTSTDFGASGTDVNAVVEVVLSGEADTVRSVRWRVAEGTEVSFAPSAVLDVAPPMESYMGWRVDYGDLKRGRGRRITDCVTPCFG